MTEPINKREYQEWATKQEINSITHAQCFFKQTLGGFFALQMPGRVSQCKQPHAQSAKKNVSMAE
jgi:hypothetical protein